MITTDELNQMMVEIAAGFEWGDSRSRVSNTPEHEQTWNEIAGQMRAIRRRGRVVDIPAEIPESSVFVPGMI